MMGEACAAGSVSLEGADVDNVPKSGVRLLEFFLSPGFLMSRTGEFDGSNNCSVDASLCWPCCASLSVPCIFGLSLSL